jgi:hypothetical protein
MAKRARPTPEARMATTRYDGAPATIGNLRHNGIEQVKVECAVPHCYHRGAFKFDDLGIEDDVEFPSIAKRRSFICTRCGSRKFRLHVCWTDNVRRDNPAATWGMAPPDIGRRFRD